MPKQGKTSSEKLIHPFQLAGGVAFVYILVASLWIIFSDYLVNLLLIDVVPLSITQIQSIKGIIYVTITGTILFAYLRPVFARHRDLVLDLKQSEKSFRTLAVNTHAAIIRFNQQFEAIYLNPAAQHIFGDNNPAHQIRLFHQHLTTVWQTGEFQSIECIHHVDDIEYYFQVNCVPEFTEDGRLVSVLCVLHDITVLKQKESELRTQKKHLNAIVNSHIDFICRYKPDGTLVYVNDAYCEFFGKSRAELLTTNFLDLSPSDQIDGIVQRLRELMQTQEQDVRIFKNISESRQVRWVEWVDYVIEDSSEEIIIQAVGRDITKRIEAEEQLIEMNANLDQQVRARTTELETLNQQLRETNEKLKQVSQIKDEFVSNVSHELRTPITSLKLQHYMLLRNLEHPHKYLGTMARETERLEHMVEDLLQLSRLDQEKIAIQFVKVDLNDLVRQFVQDRQPLAEQKNINLTVQITQSLPPVNVDLHLLEQVLGILVTNALNFTPEGGQIIVSTFTEEDIAQTLVGFKVSDTGPGIAKDEEHKIFERFYRGTSAHQTKATGTGLGLAIAKEIIDRHQGQITLDRDTEQGATFVVMFNAETVANV